MISGRPYTRQSVGDGQEPSQRDSNRLPVQPPGRCGAGNEGARFSHLLTHNLKLEHRWDRHNDYELELVRQCYSQLYPKWGSRLAGADAYLKDNCWAMLESLGVEFPEQRLSTDEKQK
jgi:hypothetical protein